MTAVISVALGNESYCFDMADIAEVKKLGAYTKMHNVPDYIAGIMNLRGRIISLIDIKHFFGQHKTKLNEDTMIAVAEIGAAIIGFVFDSTDGVFYIDINEIKPTLETIDPKMMRYTKGQLELNGKMCSLIGLKEIIEGDEIKAFVEQQTR